MPCIQSLILIFKHILFCGGVAVRNRRRIYLFPAQKRMIFLLLSILILSLIFLLVLDAKLRPAVYDLAQIEAQSIAVEVMNSAIENEITSENIRYSDIIEIKYNDDGIITSLTSDIIKMNLLKTNIVQAANKAIHLDSAVVKVPLGAATGMAVFAGCGPVAEIGLSIAGAVNAEFENVFFEAGVNQTEHRVMLNITADVTIILDGNMVKKQVETAVCVAQTVIVGRAPDLVSM